MQVGDIKTNTFAPKTATSFAGGSYIEKGKRVKEIEKNLVENMPKAIKSISKFSKFNGEIPNLIINALGTGLVAPIFIKYNFLSKTDDDTRTYSALRQPISAVLSVATGVAVVYPFNKLLDNMSKNGFFFKLDDFKTASSNFNKPTESVEKLVDVAMQKDGIEYTSGAKKVVLSPDEMKAAMHKAIKENLDSVTEALDRRGTEKIGKQISRCEYYRHNKVDVKKVLAELNTVVESEKTDKERSKFFKSKIKELKKKKANQELIDLVQDISLRPDRATQKSKIVSIDAACNKFSKFKSLEDVAKEVASNIDKDNKILREEKVILENMQKAVTEGKSLKNIAKMSEGIQGSTFVYDVIQKHIGNIEANLKGFKSITGLVVSLAILPVACSMLNYIYPRFMDKFFPRLSDKKKNKTADTFQKAPSSVADPKAATAVKEGGK